jgi:hypothetical protein
MHYISLSLTLDQATSKDISGGVVRVHKCYILPPSQKE